MGFKARCASKYDSLGYTGDYLDARVGLVYAMKLEDGRFGACQVLWENTRIVELIALDWIGDCLPTLQQLADKKALPDAYLACSEKRPPLAFTSLGVCPAFAEIAPTVIGLPFGYWTSLMHTVLGRWKWKHVVPPAVRLSCETAEASMETLMLSLWGGETTPIAARRDKVFIGSQNDYALSIPQGQAVHWQALDALGALRTIDYEGNDESVLDYIATRYLVTNLRWNSKLERSGSVVSRKYI